MIYPLSMKMGIYSNGHGVRMERVRKLEEVEGMSRNILALCQCFEPRYLETNWLLANVYLCRLKRRSEQVIFSTYPSKTKCTS